jgi:hypothetical protein
LGITVAGYGIGGSTAASWSRDTARVTNAIRANTDVKWVWWIAGGNDASSQLPQTPIETIVANAIRDSRVVADAVYAANPRVHIFQFGYDILNFGGLICGLAGGALFPACFGQGPRCINTQFIRLQTEFVNSMPRFYPVGSYSAVNLLGSMQRRAGIPNTRPGAPNLDLFTPDSLMADCIHANTAGYTAVMEALRDVFFRTEMDTEWYRNFNITVSKEVV